MKCMTDPAASQPASSIGLSQSGRACQCSADATAEGPSEESRKKQNECLIAWEHLPDGLHSSHNRTALLRRGL
jgi:hypothetical protein